MTIEAITSSNTYAAPLSASAIRGSPRGPKREAASGAKSPAATESLDTEAMDAQQADAAGEQEAAGVLRLLQAGHFKGVADVRLRIVFHDQLLAAEIAATKSAVEQAVTSLSVAVDAELTRLASLAPLEEQQLAALAGYQQTFDAAVSGATQEFLGADQPSGPALTSSTQGAFDTLAASLESLLAPAPAYAPGDVNGDGIVDAQDLTIMKANFGQSGIDIAGDLNLDGAVDSQDLTILKANFGTATGPAPLPAATEAGGPLADLREAFAAAMAELAEALSGAALLPEPSGSENGAAYSKFVAQYNALRGLEETAPAPDPVLAAVDTEA